MDIVLNPTDGVQGTNTQQVIYLGETVGLDLSVNSHPSCQSLNCGLLATP